MPKNSKDRRSRLDTKRNVHPDSRFHDSPALGAVSSSPAMVPTVEETHPWTSSKSPLQFQVRRFIGRTGREEVMLIDHGCGPAFYPTVFMACRYDKSNKSPHTRAMVLRSIAMARLWAAARGRDLDYDLRQGPLLSLTDAEVLADHLMLTIEEQVIANEVAGAVQRNPRTTSALEQYRPNPKKLSYLPTGLKAGAAFARITWVARYVEWHLRLRLGSHEQPNDDLTTLAVLGWPVVARLKERGRNGGRTLTINEALEGVPQETIDLISEVLKAGNPKNPFTPGFIQLRNELLWHLYVSTGSRRTEVLTLLVKDVSVSQQRMYISQSKTQPRTVPISLFAADLFDTYIEKYWSTLPRAARTRGFLFTSQNGDPLSARTINRIFVTIRTKVPNCPDFLTPHTARRSWNDRFSESNDAAPPNKRLSREEEIQSRNYLQGWVKNSPMGRRYANRHIRRKADEIGETLANTISHQEQDAR